jgi:cellulose biosynthesis protein BcsQ
MAFVSGKGGVGKTMLAVAAAKELAEVQPTLVLDLDFFNRGLSGLLTYGVKAAAIDRPSFLSHQGDNSQDGAWDIIRVSEKLYHLVYPDISQETVERVEQLDVYELSEQLLTFIHRVASTVGCRVVVLDCHGGPDALSFAACLIAQHSLLISEPDRITMYGTLHFLRRLNDVARSQRPTIHLVFNKVVEDFSPRFLRKVYNDHLGEYFDGRPLLAAFPFEVYLTKEFEKYPFVTEYYPQSMLAQKIQVLLSDLLREDRPDALSLAARTLPAWVQAYRRYFFGGTPKFLTLDFTTAVGFIVLLVFVLLLIVSGKIFDFPRLSQSKLAVDIMDSGVPQVIFVIWALWWLTSILLSWTQSLDRQLTLSARRDRFLHLVMYTFTMGLLWYFPVLGFYLLFVFADRPITLLSGLTLFVIATWILWVWSGQLYRTYRDYRYSGYTTGPVARLITVIVLEFLLILTHWTSTFA